MAAIEDEIAHVDDVGLFEGDDGIAARVGRAVVLQRHPFAAHLFTPGVDKRRIGHHLLDDGCRRLSRGLTRGDLACRRGSLQFGHVGVRQDLLHRWPENWVAPRVVAVVMGIHQIVDGHSGRAFLHTVQANLCRGWHLGIHHHHARFRDVVADGAALAGEEAHRASQWGERGDRRCRRSLPGGLCGNLGEQVA